LTKSLSAILATKFLREASTIAAYTGMSGKGDFSGVRRKDARRH
jgi:hypothetical protein